MVQTHQLSSSIIPTLQMMKLGFKNLGQDPRGDTRWRQNWNLGGIRHSPHRKALRNALGAEDDVGSKKRILVILKK